MAVNADGVHGILDPPETQVVLLGWPGVTDPRPRGGTDSESRT